jgi:hypothetical protein
MTDITRAWKTVSKIIAAPKTLSPRRPSNSENKNISGSGPNQDAGTAGDGRSGCENIIHEQYAFPGYQTGKTHGKCILDGILSSFGIQSRSISFRMGCAHQTYIVDWQPT